MGALLLLSALILPRDEGMDHSGRRIDGSSTVRLGFFEENEARVCNV